MPAQAWLTGRALFSLGSPAELFSSFGSPAKLWLNGRVQGQSLVDRQDSGSKSG